MYDEGQVGPEGALIDTCRVTSYNLSMIKTVNFLKN